MLRLRGKLVAAIRAAVGVLEPLLDAVVAKHVLAPGEAEGGLVDSLGTLDAKVVVADDTSWKQQSACALGMNPRRQNEDS